MITRKRISTIAKLALPISISLSSSLVMSLVNLAMVRALGNAAIAAVGLSVASNELVLAVLAGLMPAVQGLIARKRGQHSTEPQLVPLMGGLLIAVGVGIPLTIICYLSTPWVFSIIVSSPEVAKIGIPFLRISFIAIIAASMNYVFEGYWAGIEKPQVQSFIVICMDCLNIALNYILMFGKLGVPPLGAAGVAISGVVCYYLGISIHCAVAYWHLRSDGLKVSLWSTKPQFSILANISRVALPAALQGFLAQAGYLVFFWMMGSLGTAELAAGNVVVRIAMVLPPVSMSLAIASATLVSKALGEGDPAGAAQWGWDTGKLGVIGFTLFGLPLCSFPKLLLSMFIADPATLSIAIMPVRLVGATAGIMSLLYIFGHTLFSLGDGNRVMTVLFCTTWLILLPGVWIVGPYLHYGLLQITLVQGVSGLIATGVVTLFWAGGRWKAIKI